MNFDFLDFSNDKVQESGFAVLPNGNYDVAITKAEIKDTKSGGKMINLCFKVFAGEYTNRTVFASLNIVNSSEKAQQIGRGQFKKILEILEMPQKLSNIEDLLGRMLTITVKVEKSEQWGEQNRVTSYKALSQQSDNGDIKF